MTPVGAAGLHDHGLALVRVVVMAKVAVPGRVKTRLAASIGEVAAAGLAEAFQRDLEMRLATLGASVTWFWHPEPPKGRPTATNRRQEGADLGARMAAAIASVAAARPGPVLVLGTDAPHVPLEWLRDGAQALRDGADVVLGPAEDGGYWTIGVSRPEPRLFEQIRWGTAGVYEETLARVHALGMVHRVLPTTYDVDDRDDLTRLCGDLAAGVVALPATAGALAMIPSPSCPTADAGRRD